MIFIKNRLRVLNKKEVKAELIYTFAFGIFINAFYSVSKNDYTFYDLLDLLLSSIGIVEGIYYLKYKE